MISEAPLVAFTTVPSEVHLELFRHLHRVDSTCLGLTCKKFYNIHRQLHGMVGLGEWDMSDIHSKQLHMLLKDWMGALVWGALG